MVWNFTFLELHQPAPAVLEKSVEVCFHATTVLPSSMLAKASKCGMLLNEDA